MDEEHEGHAHGGPNWPGTATARGNWTDPLIVVFLAVELLGEAIRGVGQMSGSILKAHSNDIGTRQQWAASAGLEIEALTRGEQ